MTEHYVWMTRYAKMMTHRGRHQTIDLVHHVRFFISEYYVNLMLLIWGDHEITLIKYGLFNTAVESHPSSSSSSGKQTQLEELKAEVKELIADSPEGIWCSDLIKLYR